MERVVRRPDKLSGCVVPPADKSISHRALILNGVARGSATVTNLSSGGDVMATLRCLRALGVSVQCSTDSAGRVRHRVKGVGRYGLKEPGDVLNAGNSGTTVRLLAGLLSAQPFLSVFTGDRSLRSRPMDRVVTPLRMMGAQLWGRGGDSLAPLSIRGGPLHGIEYTLPMASAQVKSAILLAGLYARGETVVHQPALSRDHTERMLRAMGAEVSSRGLVLAIRPGELQAVDVSVPADMSAAACWLVAAICHPCAEISLPGVGLNPGRTGILEALSAMGARISIEERRGQGSEPVGDLVAQSSSLRGVEVGGELVPRVVDEIPLLAVAACFAEGTTVVRDASELRVKESDRIGTTVRELSRMGADIEERPDGMVIRGTGRLVGARCRSYGDHRLAMALGVAGLLAEGETVVRGAQAAAATYPSFWEDLQELAPAGGLG